MRRSALCSVLLLTAAVAGTSAQVPKQWPLAPVPPEGQRVAPFFDGFYENADGTITVPDALRPYMGGLEKIG